MIKLIFLSFYLSLAFSQEPNVPSNDECSNRISVISSEKASDASANDGSLTIKVESPAGYEVILYKVSGFGEEIIQKKNLTASSSSIVFDKLKSSKAYAVKVVFEQVQDENCQTLEIFPITL